MAAFSRVPMITVPFESAEGDDCAPAGAPVAPAPAPAAQVDEERTLLGIRQARDLVLARNRELIDKLAAAEDQIAEITYERDDLAGERQEALRQLALLGQENAMLQTKVVQLSDQLANLSQAEQVYVMARGDIEGQLAAAAKERDDALAALSARDTELSALREQLAAGGAVPAGGSLSDAGITELQEQLAAARQDAEVARQEVAAQESRRSEEKQALEARINALEAQVAASQAARKQIATSPKKGVSRLPPPPPPSVVAGHTAPAPTPAAAPVQPPKKPLSDAELREAVALIRRGIEGLQSQPATPDSLEAIEQHFRVLTERSAGGGLNSVHHLATLGWEVISRLRTAPARVPAALPILLHSTEMLGWLAMRGRELMIDLTGALVYAVDDDVDNCECVATALEKVAVQTKYSVRPDAALAQIGLTRCDLIVLDVDLPGMDGFELRKLIRALPDCATTPIIFLSGHLSTAERLAALGDVHCQFAPKPYNLGELALRILASIVESRLG